MLKNGALQWSIGFTITKTRPGRAGVRELVEVNELLELSVVPVPVNEGTRTTAAKSIDDDAMSRAARSCAPANASSGSTRTREHAPITIATYNY